MGKRQLSDDREAVSKPVPGMSGNVDFGGKSYVTITEGLATVIFPKPAADSSKKQTDSASVFYNPVQQFNRDMSVLAIKTFADILDSERQAKVASAAGRREEKKHPTIAQEYGQTTSVHSENRATMVPLPLESLESASESRDIVEPAGQAADSPPTQNYPSDISASNSKMPVASSRFCVLDALSATGLRALRYSQEIPSITSITANDLDLSAVESIVKNIDYNKSISSNNSQLINGLSKIKVSHSNALLHMYSVLGSTTARPALGALGDSAGQIGRYDVIDLDPYGTAAPFLDAAVQAVSDGGMLCVTCTDSAVWASTGYSEKCYSLYGGVSVKAEWSHEAGLRLILHSISTAAGKYGCSIEPLLSLSIDFYARVYVRIKKSPAEVKKLASKTMIVYTCDEGCGSWVEQIIGKAKECTTKNDNGTFMKFGLARAPSVGTHCLHCGTAMHLGGPMWRGPLHSSTFIDRLLSSLPTLSNVTYPTIPRITGMLHTALEETTLADYPFFYNPSKLSKVVHCEAPPQAALRGALITLGYKVVRSHCKPNSLKTDAPAEKIWEAMRQWAKMKSEKDLKVGTAGHNIMQKVDPDAPTIKFDESLGKQPDSGLVRYQINPAANWGPMGRAKGDRGHRKKKPDNHDTHTEKRARLET